MYILGIDTSTNILDVAVIRDGVVVAEVSSIDERTHSERAMVAVRDALEKARVSVRDVDVFACCVGPGSYTGVRIGVAIAMGMARGLGASVMGISALDLMVHASEGFVAPMIDARNGAVFTAFYQDGVRISEPRRMLRADVPPEYSIIEPADGKWAGIDQSKLTGDLKILYLGGSV